MYTINCFFSIIIPVYNTEKYLRCINSIMNQTFTKFEIIIVNDCSNSNYKKIIKSHNDDRIIYIKQERNKSTLSARKTGSIDAKDYYITYIVPDDELYNYYLKKEEKLKYINNKLLHYFFSIISDVFYTNIRIFSINNINVKNTLEFNFVIKKRVQYYDKI